MKARDRIMVAASAIGAAMAAAAIAEASETINYSYDARGRLVSVKRSGSVNNNVNTAYGYDKADNRTFRNTTGVP